jgi:hypothetical protein
MMLKDQTDGNNYFEMLLDYEAYIISNFKDIVLLVRSQTSIF